MSSKNKVAPAQSENEVAPAQSENEANSQAAHPAPDQPQEDSAPTKKHTATPIKNITVGNCATIKVKDLPPLFEDDGETPTGKTLLLLRVAGYVRDLKSGSGTYGDWTKMIGDFAATNYVTGEVFASRECMLPGAYGDALIETVSFAIQKGGESVKFSCDISVSRSKREPTKKYVFTVRPVLDVEFSSPAMQLLSM